MYYTFFLYYTLYIAQKICIGTQRQNTLYIVHYVVIQVVKTCPTFFCIMYNTMFFVLYIVHRPQNMYRYLAAKRIIHYTRVGYIGNTLALPVTGTGAARVISGSRVYLICRGQMMPGMVVRIYRYLAKKISFLKFQIDWIAIRNKFFTNFPI